MKESQEFNVQKAFNFFKSDDRRNLLLSLISKMLFEFPRSYCYRILYMLKLNN